MWMGEKGTGAAPQEFSNYVGAPFMDGLTFVENMLGAPHSSSH